MTGVTDTKPDPKARRPSRNGLPAYADVRDACRRGEHCAKCGRALDDSEAVWWQQVGTMAGGVITTATFTRVHAPCCEDCADASYGRRQVGPRPCRGCGRPVTDVLSSYWRRRERRIPVCCERCRSRDRAARRADAVARRERVYRCAECDGEFTPSRRGDARYCSGACRQRAYRRRKASDAVTVNYGAAGAP